jgi:hypothetical protein
LNDGQQRVNALVCGHSTRVRCLVAAPLQGIPPHDA